jgi:hypothetical protein
MTDAILVGTDASLDPDYVAAQLTDAGGRVDERLFYNTFVVHGLTVREAIRVDGVVSAHQESVYTEHV